MVSIPQGTVSVTEIIRYLLQDGYLKRPAAAAYVGVSLRKFDEFIPRLPHYRIDGLVLFRKSELDAWMLRHRVDQNDVDQIVDDVVGDLRSR